MNGHYSVVVPDAIRRAISRFPKKSQLQIAARIDALAVNPRPHGCVKLSGHDILWRVRAGDYRVIYEIHDDHRVVIVLIVAHRRESYRGL